MLSVDTNFHHCLVKIQNFTHLVKIFAFMCQQKYPVLGGFSKPQRPLEAEKNQHNL